MEKQTLNKNKDSLPIINFKLHLILFLVTISLWTPFYNLLCFLGLNKIANKFVPEGVISPKNSAIGNFLIAATIIGSPFAFYHRFQLLKNYIETVNSHLNPLPKTKDENGKEVKQEKPTCLEPKKFIGLAITTFLLIGTLIASLTIVIYYLVQDSLPDTIWGNGAYMIFVPIGIAALFTGFAFSVRTAKEEQKWAKAYNSLISEISKK